MSVCAHAHAQTKKPTASNFGPDSEEDFWEDFEAIFF